MERVTKEQLPEFAASVLKHLPEKDDAATLIALSGELGAGKTTFMQAFARALSVQEVVQSPTYVLMKKYAIAYRSFKTLVHIDAYRLEKPEEFEALEPSAFLRDPHALVCVEWFERVADVLPPPDLTLTFSSQDAGEGERYIQVS